MSCIKGAIFSVVVNGQPVGFFNSTQGIRQGDPLFALHFIVMAEALSRSILVAHNTGNWKDIQIPKTQISLTHY